MDGWMLIARTTRCSRAKRTARNKASARRCCPHDSQGVALMAKEYGEKGRGPAQWLLMAKFLGPPTLNPLVDAADALARRFDGLAAGGRAWLPFIPAPRYMPHDPGGRDP